MVMEIDCVWAKKKRGFNSYANEQIQIMINYFIKECYFTVGNLKLLYCISIFMGIDPEPFWETLCLYDYEADFISSRIKTDKSRAIKFKNTSLLIDDECNSNDSGEFSTSFHVIYLNELQLKYEHRGFHATFFDLDNIVLDAIYKYKLHDIRYNHEISMFYCWYARSKW